MNQLQHFNEIEILFENCECLRVETAAIREFHFHVSGQRYLFNNSVMNCTTEVDDFVLELDLSNPGWYSTYDSRKVLMPDPAKRITESNDICRFYINGTSYSVPWDGEKYANGLQKTTRFKTVPGDPHVRIEIIGNK